MVMTWQEWVAYGIIAAVVVVVIYRQIKRFRKPEQHQCSDSTCAGCALKEHCTTKGEKTDVEHKSNSTTEQ